MKQKKEEEKGKGKKKECILLLLEYFKMIKLNIKITEFSCWNISMFL